MKIIQLKKDLQSEIDSLKIAGKKIGFVPTMGALHAGHIVLVSQSVAQNDVTIVSIFVNPTQFNNQSDLDKYPRNLEKDAELLQQAGCNLIIAPEAIEIYNSDELDTRFSF